MSLAKVTHQPSVDQTELPLSGWGEAPPAPRSDEAEAARQGAERSGTTAFLMGAVVARPNALAALQRVPRNKASPGIDGRTVADLGPDLREHWETRTSAAHQAESIFRRRR